MYCHIKGSPAAQHEKYEMDLQELVSLLNSSELSAESRGSCWASNSRSVQVLEGDDSSLDTGSGRSIVASCWEADCYTWVVSSMAGRDVGFEVRNESITVGRAGTRNLDVIDTDTVTSAIWILAGGNPKLRH
jgi:hypothetical protein